MPARRSAIQRSTLAYTALAALFILSITYFGRIAYHQIDNALHARQRVRPPIFLGDANWGIVDPQPEATAAGVKSSDKLLAVEGQPMEGFVVYYGRILNANPG